VPRQTVGHQPVAHVVAFNVYARQHPPVAILAVAVNRHRLALGKRRQPLAGLRAERLADLGRVDARQPHLVLDVARVQRPQRVAVVNADHTPDDRPLSGSQRGHDDRQDDQGAQVAAKQSASNVAFVYFLRGEYRLGSPAGTSAYRED
jgi:hypothetical protein